MDTEKQQEVHEKLVGFLKRYIQCIKTNKLEQALEIFESYFVIDKKLTSFWTEAMTYIKHFVEDEEISVNLLVLLDDIELVYSHHRDIDLVVSFNDVNSQKSISKFIEG